MNVHNPELKRQASSYAEVSNRLWNAKPKPRLAPPSETKVYVRHMAPQIPLWMRENTHFDAHYATWQFERAIWGTPVAYLKRRCEEMHIPYAMMVGPSRTTEVSVRRHLVIWEMMRTFKLSFPSLGRLMGGRDHTSALYGYRRIDAMTGAERAQINTPLVPKARRKRKITTEAMEGGK